jgi:hypothetical protein
MFLRIFLILITLSLTACWEEKEIRDGALSDDAMLVVRPFLGNYAITFGDRTTEATLTLNGNKLLLLPNGDLLRDECLSVVGSLKRFAVEAVEGKPEIRRIAFQFDPGKCSDSVVGKELELELEPNQTIRAAILQRIELADRCDYWHPPSGLPTDPASMREKKPPSFGCHREPIPFYIDGTVKKLD